MKKRVAGLQDVLAQAQVKHDARAAANLAAPAAAELAPAVDPTAATAEVHAAAPSRA